MICNLCVCTNYNVFIVILYVCTNYNYINYCMAQSFLLKALGYDYLGIAILRWGILVVCYHCNPLHSNRLRYCDVPRVHKSNGSESGVQCVLFVRLESLALNVRFPLNVSWGCMGISRGVANIAMIMVRLIPRHRPNCDRDALFGWANI